MKEYPMLISLMATFDVDMSDLRKVLEFKNLSTVSRRVNGKRNWKLEEAKKVTDYFNELDDDNHWTIEDIFFSKPIPKSQQKVS